MTKQEKIILLCAIQHSAQDAYKKLLSVLTDDEKELMTNQTKTNSLEDCRLAWNQGEIARKFNIISLFGLAKTAAYYNFGKKYLNENKMSGTV